MKKTVIFFLFAAMCAVSVQAKTIYLKPDIWASDGATFGVHTWKGTDENPKDAMMSGASKGLYKVDIPDENDKIIFVRMAGGTTSFNWEAKWNQTDDQAIPAGKDCFTITGWGEGDDANKKSVGTWSKQVDPSSVKCYLAGEGFPGASWDAGSHVEMPGNAISFTGLTAGSYKFKITDNTWDYILGFSDVNASCSDKGYSNDKDGNIVVVLKNGGDIALSVTNDGVCVKINGETEQVYATAVPSQCTDVLMQGFYYDSYDIDSTHAGTLVYGDTKWKTLLPQTGEIGAYFDLIWLPPSAYSSGVGYHPKQYSNQNSDWGSRADLEKLIAAFHNSGTKVVADIVINHVEAMASWCDFAVQDFGEYGKFEVDGSYICQNDEMNADFAKADTLAGECWGTATGPYDDGANWDAARDWAHDSPKVQELFKAYLKWMKNVMKYDGWRYDKGDGFNNWHMDNYNKASEPYIAFKEHWSGNDEIKHGIEEANMNMMALDFQTKYSAIDAIAGWNYVGRGWGLMADDYWKRHAVTWVDNHDMFLREDAHGQEFGGYENSMTDGLKYRLLDANALILSMPGVPCVFYPHWHKYKEFIKPMINARHLAGVHSESEVKDEEWDKYGDRNTGYKATIVGKNGWLILCLGTKANKTGFGPDYKLIASGYNVYNDNGSQYNESYEMWVNATGDVAPGIIATASSFFEDKDKGIDVRVEAVGGSGTAVIYYTTDGTNPTTSSRKYGAPLKFKQTTTLKVMAVCGTAQSAVQTYTYTYREPLKRGIRVRFNKPDEWQKVFIYAWVPGTDEEGNPTSENLMGAYPGKRIYQDAEGWYFYEFDAEMKTVHFCINSGDDCGGVNVRSNDLEANYDVCYGWREGKAEDSNEELQIDCDTDLKPAFDLVLTPESGFFRSQEEGVDVTIRAIGAENAMIFYTTDGSEPTTNSTSAQGEVTFTVKETTTVKAYAQHDKDKTEVYTATYTYKAPQSGALTVKFQKPEEWEDLYLYAFTRVKAGGKFKDTPYSLDGNSPKWPGMKWVQKDGEWYTHTMKDDIKDIYVIFTEGDKKPQTQDIYLAENTCYLWNGDCGKAVVDSDCDGKMDDGSEHKGIEDVEHDVPQFDASQPVFNILGQRVGADYIGIVIQNGHKYLILR